MFAFWSWLAGAAAGCRCKVPLQGAAAGRCCQSAVCAVEFGAGAGPGRRWCGTWVLVPLQGGRCEISMAVRALGPDGYAISRKDNVWLCHLGSILA